MRHTDEYYRMKHSVILSIVQNHHFNSTLTRLWQSKASAVLKAYAEATLIRFPVPYQCSTHSDMRLQTLKKIAIRPVEGAS